MSPRLAERDGGPSRLHLDTDQLWRYFHHIRFFSLLADESTIVVAVPYSLAEPFNETAYAAGAYDALCDALSDRVSLYQHPLYDKERIRSSIS